MVDIDLDRLILPDDIGAARVLLGVSGGVGVVSSLLHVSPNNCVML